jgi:hypothetical protein
MDEETSFIDEEEINAGSGNGGFSSDEDHLSQQ